MWEIKFSAEGEEGRSRQIAKMQHNGVLADALSVAGKVLAKQPQTIQKAITRLQFQSVGASTKDPVFRKP